MRAKEIILKSFARAKKERGLKIITPSSHLSEGHIKKADHNLIVMTDLNNLKHEDWVVIVAYYALYHSALSILSKIGLESKDHATTVAILEYFFGKQIDKKLLEKFNEIKKKKDHLETIRLEEKYINYLWNIKKSRENVQYGITTNYKETENIMNNTRDFVNKIKILLEEIKEELINIITKETKNLQNQAHKSRKPEQRI